MDFQSILRSKFGDIDFSEYVDFCMSRAMKEGVGEYHHILPRCKFPDQRRSKENLVLLDYPDHARAHYLLFKVCPIVDFALAFDLMLKVSDKFHARDIQRIDDEIFETIGAARKVVAEGQRIRIKDLNASGNNPNLGKTRSKESKLRMSEAQLGSKRSHESIQRQVASLKKFQDEVGYEVVTCPHCGKAGKSSGMKSWHFEYCKSNPNREERGNRND